METEKYLDCSPAVCSEICKTEIWKFRQLTHVRNSNRAYLSMFLTDDAKLEGVAEDMFIVRHNQI